ncbi:hypothetical protein [Dyella tabacisoli]|uniref:hypothetical protein n=1 Tax=Dyella tabacisoli TaxID=2282381 RepID=UPI0013B36F3C|nr:hypothetical protein [Dyella tabacisoli]
MNIISDAVRQAVNLAMADGNSVDDISDGWTKVRQVVRMHLPLTDQVKNSISKEIPSLVYWFASETPHDAPSEGYISEVDLVGISFPIGK